MEVVPLTAERLADLADLFETNKTTKGCWCMWYLLSGKDRQAGWDGGNRERFEAYAVVASPPAGLLAYQEGVCIGWCAVGPRSRFPATIGPRATILRSRDPDEDDAVWLVPCFFVRVGFRRSGATYALLEAAVALAHTHGAKAVEGFPVSGDKRSNVFVGREKVFRDTGFTAIAHPTPRRVVMRRELNTAPAAGSSSHHLAGGTLPSSGV